jgi:hypothetical protein
MASHMSNQIQKASSRDKDLFIPRSRQPAVDPEAHKSCVRFKVTAFFSATGTWVDAG